jgi:hypothetical protein
MNNLQEFGKTPTRVEALLTKNLIAVEKSHRQMANLTRTNPRSGLSAQAHSDLIEYRKLSRHFQRYSNAVRDSVCQRPRK